MSIGNSLIINAFGWNSANVLLRQLSQFVIATVLARLVEPAEFGLIAVLGLFVAIAGVFVECGFGSALVQRKDLTIEDESTVLWFTLAAGTLTALLLGLSAQEIAIFFGEPRLVGLTWMMSLNIWFSSLLAIPGALLTKKLDFRTLTIASLTGVAAGGVVGIWLGAHGAGAWSLAAQTVVASGVTSAAVWILFPWRPALVFRLASLRALVGFGVYMFLASLMEVLANRFYTALLGKLHSPLEVGLYARGASMKDFPQSIITSLTSRIVFPLFPLYRDDPLALASRFARVLRSSMALNAPIMLGLAATAPDVIAVLFGRRWLLAIPILEVLCLAGLMMPMQILSQQALIGMGRSRLFFNLQLIRNVQVVLILLAASPFGMMAIAWATVASTLVAFAVNSYYTDRVLSYGAWSQFMDVAPYIGLAGAMAVVVLGARMALADVTMFLRLPTEVSLGAVMYLSTLRLFRLEAFTTGLSLLRGRTTGAHAP